MSVTVAVPADLCAVRRFPSPATAGESEEFEAGANAAPEWWNIENIPVTSRATYDTILRHPSYRYIQSLLADKSPTLMKGVPQAYFCILP